MGTSKFHCSNRFSKQIFLDTTLWQLEHLHSHTALHLFVLCRAWLPCAFWSFALDSIVAVCPSLSDRSLAINSIVNSSLAAHKTLWPKNRLEPWPPPATMMATLWSFSAANMSTKSMLMSFPGTAQCWRVFWLRALLACCRLKLWGMGKHCVGASTCC